MTYWTVAFSDYDSKWSQDYTYLTDAIDAAEYHTEEDDFCSAKVYEVNRTLVWGGDK